MSFVFARERFVKFHPLTGAPHVFGFGQRVAADDPIVVASPQDFMSASELAEVAGGVERATAAPGERRGR